MFRTYKAEGIVISRKNYSEADRILTIFSKEYGKVTVIAKGIRKPKSRKRGSLEIFSRVRFSAVKGKGMDIITEVEMLDSFGSVRNDLRKVSVGYYFLEVIDKTTNEGESLDSIYLLLREYLQFLRTSVSLKTLRKQFVTRLIWTLGYWPRNKEIQDPDKILEEVVERKITSKRVGKLVLS
jgi:DNA repair protein RecO (recombination protein O)